MYFLRISPIVLLALVHIACAEPAVSRAAGSVDSKKSDLAKSVKIERVERSLEVPVAASRNAELVAKKPLEVASADSLKREKRHSKKVKVAVPVIGFATKKVKVEKKVVNPIVKKAVLGGIIGGAKMMMKKPKTKKVVAHVPAGLPVTHHVQETLIIQPQTTFDVTKVKSLPAKTKLIKAVKLTPGYTYPIHKTKLTLSPLTALTKIKNHIMG